MGFLFLGLSFPLPCFASETTAPTEEVSSKINLEAVLVSIDNFFNRYPFFVATVTFIWLVVIPLTEEYLQKYKFISAINAFKKLQDDPNSQLLDIRDSRSLASLESPNLKILNKSALQVEFREGNEEGFVKRVLENFGEPENTTICIIDNFDGNSMKAAELLVKNGFKEAYAIRGGIRGKKGWQEIQETLLPPSVCVYPKKKVKLSKELNTNGGVQRQDNNDDDFSSATSFSNSKKENNNNRDVSSINPTSQSKGVPRPSSPYPNYPDLKPPSSPTPSKPKS
ncbi:Rhodanese-like domain-containing protein 4A [Abeliophyllum distichum]|uniref:Rhodanese-like domain-containing protein 4A n=1 Tax=Abeliophyllum distichum TaxID=126358 RepID=A0ABD1Q4P3_9LAMI